MIDFAAESLKQLLTGTLPDYSKSNNQDYTVEPEIYTELIFETNFVPGTRPRGIWEDLKQSE